MHNMPINIDSYFGCIHQSFLKLYMYIITWKIKISKTLNFSSRKNGLFCIKFIRNGL